MPCGAILEVGWLRVRRTVRKEDEVSEGDHVELDVRLLPVLAPERLGALLREELLKRGWDEAPDGALTKVFGEAVATLEKDASRIRLAVSGARRVAAEATATGTAREEDQAAQDAIGARAEADATGKLEQRKRLARDAVVRENLDKLERVAGDVQHEVDEVTSATTRRALVERAAQLGAVESVDERRSADGLELVIRVKT
ncbi:MAG: hypothetical protein ACOZQL_08685 [Myxococcota bacterium]